jgi:hypothetical protein
VTARSIVDFLNARLAEDEREAQVAAEAIGDGTWIHGDRQVRSARLALVAQTVVHRYIARYDPARVLREVAAKRALLERHLIDYGRGHESAERGGPCPEIGLLAGIYMDHPDYDESWKL